ncbi:Rv3235 family protein [Streptomyces sp. NPDC051976]|uniref:Rv3235 family protein n=1 Tax=Streptomyces sp. NPDC051976 TaxID=3154947 RepID=UPI0034219387
MPTTPVLPRPTAPTTSATRPQRRQGAGAAPPGRVEVRRPTGRPATAVRPAVRPPAPHLWFAGRLLDVLTGRLPLTCLAGRVRDEAYQRLWELHGARADWRQRVRGRTPYVYRCRYFRTAGGALEVTAVVALDREVFRALAFRLEPGGPGARSGYGQGRWHCTELEAR